jgi:hypothetical protein
MLELLIMLPNLAAGYLTMRNNAFMANCVYCLGYVLFIWYNIQRTHDLMQVIYFSLLWVMAMLGVMLYLWNKKNIRNVNKL